MGYWKDSRPDDPNPGAEQRYAKSDAQGLFVIRGLSGPRLYVGVDKPGYLATDEASGNFPYAAPPLRLQLLPSIRKEALHVPDPNKPVIFRLKSIVGAEILRLLKSYYKIGESRPFHIAADKLPTSDNLEGIKDDPGIHSILVEIRTDKAHAQSTWNGRPFRYDWSLILTVKGGGVIASDAPYKTGVEIEAEKGPYLESQSFGFQGGLPEGVWKPSLARQVFVRFPDGTYARLFLNVATDTGRPFINLTSYFNAVGKNFTLDPTKIQKIEK